MCVSEQDLGPAHLVRKGGMWLLRSKLVPGLAEASGTQGQPGASLGVEPHVNVVTTCGPSEAQTLGQEQEVALSSVTGSR